MGQTTLSEGLSVPGIELGTRDIAPSRIYPLPTFMEFPDLKKPFSFLFLCILLLQLRRCSPSELNWFDVGFTTVYYEYVLLPLINKEAALAYGRAEYL